MGPPPPPPMFRNSRRNALKVTTAKNSSTGSSIPPHMVAYCRVQPTPPPPNLSLRIDINLINWCSVGKEISKERSFICRFKCILNTNAGFFKVNIINNNCISVGLFDSGQFQKLTLPFARGSASINYPHASHFTGICPLCGELVVLLLSIFLQ